MIKSTDQLRSSTLGWSLILHTRYIFKLDHTESASWFIIMPPNRNTVSGTNKHHLFSKCIPTIPSSVEAASRLHENIQFWRHGMCQDWQGSLLAACWLHVGHFLDSSVDPGLLVNYCDSFLGIDSFIPKPSQTTLALWRVIAVGQSHRTHNSLIFVHFSLQFFVEVAGLTSTTRVRSSFKDCKFWRRLSAVSPDNFWWARNDVIPWSCEPNSYSNPLLQLPMKVFTTDDSSRLLWNCKMFSKHSANEQTYSTVRNDRQNSLR